MFTSISLPKKNTSELRNNVNLTSKKLKISVFLEFLYSDKKPSKSGSKTIHHEAVHVG